MFRLGFRFQFREILSKIAIFTPKIFSPLQILISPRNQVQIRGFLIPWNRFEVFFLKIPFCPISTIKFLSDLIKFEDYVKKFLNSLWIRVNFLKLVSLELFLTRYCVKSMTSRSRLVTPHPREFLLPTFLLAIIP